MNLYTEKLVRGEASNISFYAALEAFYNMGFATHEIDTFENLDIKEDHVFLGSIAFVHQALNLLQISIPEPFDYPDSLQEFFREENLHFNN